MTIFTIIGIWIFIVAGLLFCSFVCGMVLGGSSGDKEESFIAGLILTMCLISFLLTGIFVSFTENPEQYGYAKIETETVEVHEQVEHQESEVVIDE